VILTPFRGVGSLRRICEQRMAQETERMRREAEAMLRDQGLDARMRSEALESFQERWIRRFNELARELSWRIVHDNSRAGRRHFSEQAQKALGVPATAVFDEREMGRILDEAAVAAATYIKTIPGQYVGKVAAAIAQDLRQEPLPENQSLPQYIHSLGFNTVKRARFIARDQFHKVSATINEHQCRDLGCEGYIWSTSHDERVVGNPSGLYPHGSRMHGDHYKRDGKFFRYDKPPADGHAGLPIACRCIQRGVIDLVKALGRA
jgi:uncharacterized protein with gpF-like domain